MNESTKIQRVLSGMRPTGRLHLGNYLGAAKGMLALQEDANFETYYTVVDIHATTTPYDPKTLRQSAREVYMDYLAIGLDPEKSAITLQSDLADLITQLSFYFSSVMSVARMQHLPTFKDKVKQHPQNVTMALLNYPVLMAADILIYKASMVPVGIDQEPHIEVTREIARKMNEIYGTDFPEPQRFATRGEYVPSLLGEGKMSKTVEGSFINLSDDLATITKKLAKVPTDAGKATDEQPNPVAGVKALLEFVELFEGKAKRQHYEDLYTTTGIRYGELKNELAAAIFEDLRPIQERRQSLATNPTYVDKVIQDGAERARAVTSKTVQEVKKAMGLG
jgi:tryptophanyl-tRNA synthetase